MLNAFCNDAPYLFLGAAFVAVGMVSAAFTVLRRKRDWLLIYFALFAILYGLRLWVCSSLLGMAEQDSTFYIRLRGAIGYVILIPAFLFFIFLGLRRRWERAVAYVMVCLGCALAIGTVFFGDSGLYERINKIAITTASLFFFIRFIASRPAKRDGIGAADFHILRWGLLIFLAFVVWQNSATFFFTSPLLLEPFGFTIFLGTLGYVAARSTLRRDQELKEIRDELRVARRIQSSILPGQAPSLANFQVAARYVPMTSVAGDLYDYVLANDQQVGLLIADVSGHGIPAALIASMVKLASASQRPVATDPARFLSGMNAALLGNTQNQFVTAAYVHLNAESEELQYSAAGHPPLLVVRRGRVRAIEQNGLMLAVFDFASYSTVVHKLEPGDRIVLNTDGILEASNAECDFFAHDRLCDLLIKTRGLSPARAADSIISSVRQWSRKQDDDLTVVICDYMPTQRETSEKSVELSGMEAPLLVTDRKANMV